MELYLMRHGIADDAAPGQPDSKRRLTGEGKKRAEAVLRFAMKGGMQPDLIVSSPYLRAFETAKIAGDQFEYRGEIIQCGALTPNSSPEDLWRELRVYADAKSLLLTSHEPLIGRTISYLLDSPALQVEVKKASIFRIDLLQMSGSPRGILQWAINPRICLGANNH